MHENFPLLCLIRSLNLCTISSQFTSFYVHFVSATLCTGASIRSTHFCSHHPSASRAILAEQCNEVFYLVLYYAKINHTDRTKQKRHSLYTTYYTNSQNPSQDKVLLSNGAIVTQNYLYTKADNIFPNLMIVNQG